MKDIYIVVEGPTEEEFINNSVAPYLRNHGINNIILVLLETSPGFTGGDMSYARYYQNVSNSLKQYPNIIVSSLIDFYCLRSDFPGYAHAQTILDKNARVTYLEQQLSLAISNPRFVPYIQLHEFEALLFCDINGFNDIPKITPQRRSQIEYVINNNPNPELINDGPMTAPSKRLKTLVPKYRKPLYGAYIALEITLPVILNKCPRFNNWIAN